MTGKRLLSPLAARLAAAFVAVAVAAVAVLAALTLTSARSEVDDLVAEVHRSDAAAAAAALARAYEDAGRWRDADLTAAAAVAARGQATLTLLTPEGEVLAAPAEQVGTMMARMHGIAVVEVPRTAPVTAPVLVDGDHVGTVALSFPASHLPGPQRQIRQALTRTAVLGTGLAVLAAVAVAVVVARQVTRPVLALTTAARRLEAGDLAARADLPAAPGELGTLATAFDRMADAVERSDRLRRQLVADVAHEVRTPLTILQGTTEALVDGVATPDEATLGSLHEEILRLGRLVDDLETLAAADAAGLHLDRQQVDLAAIAAAVADLARPAAYDASLTLTTDLHPAPVHADPARLRQALMAIVANALAYTPAGGTITISTASAAGTAVAVVSDTGPGIDESDLEHLFDRFYRGQRTRSHPGSGIGLAVAHELVTAHGGTITAATSDRGATFTITLPR